MKTHLIILIMVLFASCEIIPDLKRDNPYDANNDDYVASERTLLEINKIEVASKQNSSPYADVEQNIYAGDVIYLNLHIKNVGSFEANRLRGNITSNNNNVTISPIETGFYLTFIDAYESIAVGRTGFGQITNGSTVSSAPNYNSYAVKFTVSPNATSNTVVPFELRITDNKNNSWTLDFNIQIK
ncbi:MAG: hypothetical protein WBJ36_06860 [Tenuifilum sp.]|uniref:hypothetical protein n=1 Tax=Tenuifilum sp. TaxID=2760880 RepID=UPI003C908BF0